MPRTQLGLRLHRLFKLSLLESSPFSASRRDVLLQSLAWTSATTLLQSACSTAPVNSRFRREGPVIIVGAGLAGLTAAYHLHRKGIPCRIFEASPRSGGRVLTLLDFNREHMFCELGGEFIDTDQTEIQSLCQEFELPLTVLGAADQGLAPNLYWFGEQYFTDLDVIRNFAPLARQIRKDAAAVSLHPPNHHAEELDRISLATYLEHHRELAPDWLRNLLLVAFIDEMGIEADQQSALPLILTLAEVRENDFRVYGTSDQAMTIRGGSRQLIEKLMQYLRSKNVEIEMNCSWVAIRQLENKKLELSFQKNERFTMTVDQVICAIPFTTLRSVGGVFELPLSQTKRTCIQELTYGTNSKMLVGFKKRFWRVREGAIPASNGYVYTDRFVQNLWDPSRMQQGTSGILTAYLGGKAGKNLKPEHLSRVIADIERIFPKTKNQQDGSLSYFNWSQAQLQKGSYAAPSLGQITRFQNVAATPELNGRLLFAGEHAAPKYQGFMNGACLSGRIAAESAVFFTVASVGTPARNQSS